MTSSFDVTVEGSLVLWTKLRVSLVEFFVGAAGCIKASSWYLWLHITTEATTSLQRSPGYGHLKSHGTATEQPPEVSSVLFVHVLLFFLQVKSQYSYILAMHWCTVRQEDENMKLKRDSWDFSVSHEVWMTGSKLLFESEQDATIWTVRKSTSLCGEWRSPVSSVLFHSLLLPLRYLELTECWKATDLSGFQIIWLWINPGT